MKNVLYLWTICACCQLQAQFPVNLLLEEVADNLEYTTEITHANDGRLFVCSQPGVIRIIDENGNVLPEPFLDISDQVNTLNEQGLLSLAFHPQFESNGWFYIFYTKKDDMNQISRFSVDPNNPNVADADSEKLIFSHETVVYFHHGGCLRFGPDGYLYISIGDAGFLDKAQNETSFLGKILRIDIDNGDPYSIPPDNPYYNVNVVKQEIYAMGLRNAWRFSFDKDNGDMWITDVGEKDYEEINFVPADNTQYLNFGWPCYEGPFQNDFSICDNLDESDFTASVSGYIYDDFLPCGGSITGGYVYRGLSDKLNNFGAYIYGDFCSGIISACYLENGVYKSIHLNENQLVDGISTFGENAEGELFVANVYSGQIFRLILNCKFPEIEVTVASCPMASDGCVDILIPDNEGIEEIQVLDSLGNLISASDYCNLEVGNYVLRSINQSSECTNDIPFVVNSFDPIINTSKTSCSIAKDACVSIMVRQNIPDYLAYHIETETGEVIDTSDYCNLGIGKHFLIVDNDSVNCYETYEFIIYSEYHLYQIEYENGVLTAQDTFQAYQWFYNDEFDINFDSIIGATGFEYIPTLTGFYRVYMTEADGCESRSYLKEVIISNTKDVVDHQTIKVTPNPISDHLILTLEAKTIEPIEVRILSTSGQVVHRTYIDFSEHGFDYRLTLDHLKSGIYYLHSTAKDIQLNTKFIKL